MLAAVVAMIPALVEPQTPAQTVQDEYAVYDLLAPASGNLQDDLRSGRHQQRRDRVSRLVSAAA
jgi:hypothetical protein